MTAAAAPGLAAALAFTARRFVAVATELDAALVKLAAKDDELRAELRQSIRLGCWDAVASALTGHTVGDTCDECSALRAALTCDKAGRNSPSNVTPDESTFCPRDHGCSLPKGHDHDCELTAALCFCAECEAKP